MHTLKEQKTLTLGDLINLSRPITGTSLNPNPNFKTLKKSQNPKTPISQKPNPNFKILKPLNQKTTLSGTLKLPTFEKNSKNSSSPNSFIFANEKNSVFCDIIDFDIRVIGNKINVLSWNFLPLKSNKNGFLEIIKWEFVELESNLEVFYLENSNFLNNSGNDINDSKSRFSLKGALLSISPISIVPCNSTKICGFLANILTCGCKLCKTKVSNLNEIHSYTESEIVYFFGYNTSSWYPAIVKLVGKIVSFANLKKKLVFIGEKESQLMYVTCEKTSLCLPKLVEKWGPICKNVVKGKGECGSYSGIVTGIYMNGMVVELDEKVMLVVTYHQIVLPHSVRIGAIVRYFSIELCFTVSFLVFNLFVALYIDVVSWVFVSLLIRTCLETLFGINVFKGKGECGLYIGTITGIYMNGMIMIVELDEKVMLVVTNQQIVLPHSVRIGAIVSIRNVHFVNPKFSWTKILILGACFKTTICLEAFSPLETGCCMYAQSQSLLGTFIDSLVYSARLWVLLLISSFRKKFAGIFSEQEILGSKHKEGLVQKYATSHLPSSVFQSRHGFFKEFCNHDSFCCDKEPNDVQLKLVAPISSVINHCNATRIKMLKQRDADSEIAYDCDQRDSFFCEGMYYRQSARSILESSKIDVVLLGLVKMSPSSGRLQLVDTTGSIDVLIPDLHSTWTVKNIYEVNDFTVVMEGVPEQSSCLVTIPDVAFSCRSIFTGVPCRKTVKVEMYILFHFRDTNLLVHPFSPILQDNEVFAELQSGIFHILLVTHKYLLKQNFQGEPTNGSSVFAEALLLPWDLCFHGKDDHPSKRMKTDKGSSGEHLSRLTNPGITNAASKGLHRCTDLCSSSGMTCSVTCRNLSNQFSTGSATLCNSNSIVNVCSREKPRPQKLLLEFKYESFCKYELLKVGGYYIIKHHKVDWLCSSNAISHANCNKVIINSTTRLWSSSFSSNQLHPNVYVCDLPSSVDLTDEIFVKCHLQNGLPIPQLKSDFSQIQSEVTIHLQNRDLEFLKDNLKRLDGNLIKPIVSLKEVTNFFWSNEVNGLVQAPGNLTDYQLPEGNLISIHGKVLSIHDSGCTVSSRLQSNFRMGQTFEAGQSVCIHVLVDHHPVRVIGLSCNHAYPVGFGPGCIADFYRILVLSGRNKLTMTVTSYIQIKSITLSTEEQCEKDNNQSVPSDLCTAFSAGSIPSVLISEITQPADCKPVQFQCRIVAIYMLLMETTKNTTYSQTSSHTRSSVFQIPLAGFVLDDGSSSSCFWASNEMAFTLLRLNEKLSHGMATNTTKAKNFSKEGDCNSVIHHVGKIVKKHGVVTVRNYGSVHDSTSQDLVFSVTSNSVFRRSDEELLKCVVLNACFGTCWTVIGSLMDSRAVGKLEKQLADMDMTMHPMQNIWIQEVHHVNPLLEARRVMQELLN